MGEKTDQNKKGIRKRERKKHAHLRLKTMSSSVGIETIV